MEPLYRAENDNLLDPQGNFSTVVIEDKSNWWYMMSPSGATLYSRGTIGIDWGVISYGA